MIQPQQLKSYLGLKWNPFLSDVPVENMHVDERMASFFWRVEQLVLDGGYGLVTGEPGNGKSVILRQLHHHLLKIPDVYVRTVARPQSRLRDFYREIGLLFGIEIHASNRYGSFQKLRDQWLTQIGRKLFRPVLLIDEAQEMPEEVLSEIRILGSSDLDARCILAVVFSGDERFLKNLQTPALLPLESRIRIRLNLDGRSSEMLHSLLTHTLREAGNEELMTPGVIKALSEQSLGNLRAMMTAGNELIAQAVQRNRTQVDEDLYFEVFRAQPKRKR